MDRLRMQSRDVVGGNVGKIAALFPHCVTERLNKDGKPELAIDFDKLRAELSNDVLEEGEERYQFTWPDKRAASRLANEPTNMTLRPCREESVDFDTTENLYIEGDNLDVLKVLRETYLGRVKMIYIDPPYNTGNDFVYNDDFSQSIEEYEANSCAVDEDGNRLIDLMQRNSESNGRFHTDWLNMIYPRLKVALDLLSDDGVIFISIDDNEADNLKRITSEIFGARNFIAQVIWERAFSPVNLKKHFSESHDYLIVFAKDKDKTVCHGLPRTDESKDRYSNPDNDLRGPWTSGDLSVGPRVESRVYEIITPSGRIVMPPSGYCWRLDEKTFKQYVQDNRIWFGPTGENVPRIKRFLSDVKEGITPMTIWKYTEVGSSQDASRRLKDLFGGKAYFDYPKSVLLIDRCLKLYSDKDSIVLDFFSGSATTAHAVMKLNAEDGGKRKFIMVQLPEVTDEKSEARKAGYKNICEIGKERIRRAGKKIKEEAGQAADGLDIGFRVLKLDSSNMEDVFYTPDKFEPSLLDRLVDNIKADRSGEDLLFQVMLDLGIELSAKIERKEIAGKEVFSVDDDYLLACFDTDVNETTIEEMAKLLPTHLVIRDASAVNDNVLDNFDQIIESYSNEKKITTHIL